MVNVFTFNTYFKAHICYNVQGSDQVHFTCLQYAGDSTLFIAASNGRVSAWDTRKNTCFMHWDADSCEIGFRSIINTLGAALRSPPQYFLTISRLIRPRQYWSHSLPYQFKQIVNSLWNICFENVIQLSKITEFKNSNISQKFIDQIVKNIMKNTLNNLGAVFFKNKSQILYFGGIPRCHPSICFQKFNRLWFGGVFPFFFKHAPISQWPLPVRPL